MAQPDSTTSTVDDFFSHCTELVFIAGEGGALLRTSRALTEAMSPEPPCEATRAYEGGR